MIRLNVFFEVGEGRRDETIRTARELVEASLGEEGCVAYDLYESVTRRDVLMICETWRDAEALASHEASEHFRRLVPRLGELSQMKAERFTF